MIQFFYTTSSLIVLQKLHVSNTVINIVVHKERIGQQSNMKMAKTLRQDGRRKQVKVDPNTVFPNVSKWIRCPGKAEVLLNY